MAIDQAWRNEQVGLYSLEQRIHRDYTHVMAGIDFCEICCRCVQSCRHSGGGS